ncbi:exonuclease SbcC [Mycetocola sp. CAN_C7]|uniref:AAA family ATPase n=1 Tax=Mycetocola sp. CAN_C7 TaxID=2787724 RepID=UPI0018CB7402
MKIQRLAVAGFGPYKEEQLVDFETFDDDGIFLITGKTGAGKSSLLDAICFALYGSVPRYDGTQPKLRSHYCEPGDPTVVDLEFRVHDVSYRVRRTPEYERPKARGSGTTVQKTTAELFVLRDGDWQGIAARPVDVARELDTILGLTKDQFLQVILLAQNRFQEFLLARNDDRQAVLRTLFGTRRFEQVELELIERRKTLGATLDSTAGSLRASAELAAALAQRAVPDEPDLGWFDSALAELTASQETAAQAATVADAEFTAADAEHRRLQDARHLQLRRDSARALLDTFGAQTAAIDADRVVLAHATRAASVWAHVAGLRRAEAAWDAAVASETIFRERYSASMYSDVLPGDTVHEADELEAVVDDLTRRLGTLEQARDEESALPQLRHGVERLEHELDARRSAVDEAERLIATLPNELDEVAEALSAARVSAAGVAEAKERVSRLDVARTAAKRAVTLDRRLIEARFAEKDASAALMSATAHQDELFARRLSGYAAELATELTDGSPCSVCGSRDHPHPADRDSAPVTELDIGAARADVAARRSDLDAASAVANSLVSDLAEAKATAGNRSIDEIEAELIDATTAQLDILAAADVVADCEQTQAELRTALDNAAPLLARLRSDLATTAEHLASARSALTAATDRVDAARAGFSSVGERMSLLQGRLDAAKALIASTAETAVREAAVAGARDVLAAQLSDNGFDSEDAVERSRRSSAEIAALDGRIREFDQSVSTARATLAEPELTGLPVEPVDPAPAAERRAEASAARDAALQVAGLLADRVTQLDTIVTRVHADQDASARLRAEFDRLRALAGAVQGNEPNTKRMRLETYVLAAQLEEIVAAANTRLRTMTGGRYTLQHDDSVQYRNTRSGLGLAILDGHTGRARATHSLSGGETFLASLALALGLAEVVTNQAGGITLDTLFIDEGFGSLDGDTLEIAMSTLDSLRSGGRTIGLISHVDAMKEQIPAKLRITVTDSGPSRIDTSLELV